MLFLGGKTLRELLADLRWRWDSDEKDAEQRRRHEEDRHRLEVRRECLELDREFPRGDQSPVQEIGTGATPPALMPPTPDRSNDRS